MSKTFTIMSCNKCNENKQNQNEESCEGLTLNSLPIIQNISPQDILYIYDVSTGTSHKITLDQLATILGELGNRIEPTFFEYTNLTELEIQYTNELKQKYGKLPTITIYDTENKIVALTNIAFDDIQNPTKVIITTDDPYNLTIKMS